MTHDCHHWGWRHVWSTNFRRFPLRSLHLSGREVGVHHQVSFSKGYVILIIQLLYFRFKSFGVLCRMPYWSFMISTLHIWIIPRWVWLCQRPQRFRIHKRGLNQRLMNMTVWHRNCIKRIIPSFQVVTRPILALISSTLGSLIWIRRDPGLMVWSSRNCWLPIRIAWCWKWWLLKRWRTIRFWRCTMRILNIFHDCIDYIIFFLLGDAEGFCLTSLAARDVLDSSTFEDALDAFSNFHQVKEAWWHNSYHSFEVWALQVIHKHVN